MNQPVRPQLQGSLVTALMSLRDVLLTEYPPHRDRDHVVGLINKVLNESDMNALAELDQWVDKHATKYPPVACAAR